MKNEPAQRTRLDQATAKVIRQYFRLLSPEMQKSFIDFEQLLNNNEALTPGQHTYLEGMYESIMGQLTGSKVDMHIDLKHKSKVNLRY